VASQAGKHSGHSAKKPPRQPRTIIHVESLFHGALDTICNRVSQGVEFVAPPEPPRKGLVNDLLLLGTQANAIWQGKSMDDTIRWLAVFIIFAGLIGQVSTRD
jgi:hypothetical protein